jgi:hypothetical protein
MGLAIGPEPPRHSDIMAMDFDCRLINWETRCRMSSAAFLCELKSPKNDSCSDDMLFVWRGSRKTLSSRILRVCNSLIVHELNF